MAILLTNDGLLEGDKITGKTLSEAVKIPVELRAGVEAPEAELVAHKYK